MPKDKNGLTDKQRRFVQEYLIDSNATQAAIRAGYSKKTAHAIGQENLRKPMIAEAVASGQAMLAEEAEITLNWLVGQSQKILRHAMTPVRAKDRYGKPTGPEIRQLSPANKAIENIAKLTGFWIERSATLPVDSWSELMGLVSGKTANILKYGQNRDTEQDTDIKPGGEAVH